MSAEPPAPQTAADKHSQAVLEWVKEAVLGLGLCPFAHRLSLPDDLGIISCPASNETGILACLAHELKRLHQHQRPETVLVVLENALADFMAFNDFLDQTDALLESGPWAGAFQIASFHPHYRFAGTGPEDVDNLTNRSPYPVLHILREASVERALAHFPTAGAEVPAANLKTLRALTPDQIRRIWPWTCE